MKLAKIIIVSLWLFFGACATPDKQQQDTLLTAASFGGKMTRPPATDPVTLEWDSAYFGATPVNYRKVDDLRLSGSATLGRDSLKTVARRISVKGAALLVVDLRQESHGIVNGNPVTWVSEKNWGNAQLINEEITRREKRQLGELKVGERLGRVRIQSLETEESMVRTQGHQYLRLTVGDYLRPSDVEVDRFVVAVRDLPELSWVHVHCRSGKGRTTLFMVLYDMMVNAKYMTFENILSRHEALSQDLLLEEFAKDEWRFQYQKERSQFLRAFYNYAKAHPRGEGLLWSEWGYDQ